MSLDDLIDTAFRRAPAVEANRLIHDVRRAMLDEQGQVVNYEVVLMGRPFSFLQQEVAPRLALFLHDKRAAPRMAFISLFVDATLYFIRGDDFFRVIRESLSLDPAAFRVVYQQWQKTGRSSAGALTGVS